MASVANCYFAVVNEQAFETAGQTAKARYEDGEEVEGRPEEGKFVVDAADGEGVFDVDEDGQTFTFVELVEGLAEAHLGDDVECHEQPPFVYVCRSFGCVVTNVRDRKVDFASNKILVFGNCRRSEQRCIDLS